MEKETLTDRGGFVVTEKTGLITPYGKIADGECRGYEPHRTEHEACGCFYGGFLKKSFIRISDGR